MTTCAYVFAAFLDATVGFRAQMSAPAAPVVAPHVVLVTIDGMGGDYLGEADRSLPDAEGKPIVGIFKSGREAKPN
jgi:hypothetical protein